ncbi:histidine phosphatase family protein [Lactobacillaceae bacterium L1_55_11]|nr:histidine phosphatase family protein [Lactobacillaceae bacterium L1_55_11]
MTTFYFIRHGQTEWNLAQRFQGGQGDSPLLPGSFADMKKLAAHLKDVHFDHVYASPIKRARQTAVTVKNDLPGDLPMSLRSDLAEFGLGQWEGHTHEEIDQKYPQDYYDYRHDLTQFDGRDFGGENYQGALDRFTRCIREISQSQPNGTVLVVAHGLILRIGLNALLKTPADKISQRSGLGNTSTTILTGNGQDFDLVDWNDTSYLGKAQDGTTTI